APGAYRVDTPVALSRGSGLGQPRDAVDYEATEESTVSFSGGASTPVEVAGQVLEGPGRVVLTGTFTVRRPEGSIEATTVELADGPFELTATPLPDGSGWAITALLQGEVTVT
ncbi:MAG: hypothetical protein M3527_04855, partial [Actinomycetota bacterium]|nr:hypothetical protein [Actinomycetota bacterium]